MITQRNKWSFSGAILLLVFLLCIFIWLTDYSAYVHKNDTLIARLCSAISTSEVTFWMSSCTLPHQFPKSGGHAYLELSCSTVSWSISLSPFFFIYILKSRNPISHVHQHDLQRIGIHSFLIGQGCIVTVINLSVILASILQSRSRNKNLKKQ